MKELAKTVAFGFFWLFLLSTPALAQWTNSMLPDQKKGSFERTPMIAVDASGIHIVYAAQDKGPGTYKLFYTQKLSNGTFSTPVRVTDTAKGLNEWEPVLSVGAQGLHVAFQLEDTEGVSSLHYALFAGSPVSPVQVFSGPAGTHNDYLAVDGNDIAHIVFFAYNGSDPDIYYTHNGQSGNFLPSPINVTAPLEPSIRKCTTPSIVAESNGIVHIAYTTAETAVDVGVSYTHNQTPYLTSHDFVASVRVNPIEAGVAYQLPNLAVDATSVYITYRRYEDFFNPAGKGRTDCYYFRLDRANPQPPATIADITRVNDLAYDMNVPNKPAPIAVAGDGTVRVAWVGSFSSQSISSKEVFYAEMDQQGNVTLRENVTNNSVRNDMPDMAVASDETVHLVYLENVGEVWYATNSAPPPVGTVCFVEDIAMSLSYKGNGPPQNRGWTATATILIHDDQGNQVEGATVSGHWSGLTSDSDTGTTGPDGTVSLDSDRINTTGTFTFTVDNVEHSSLVYDPELNVMDTNSISNLTKTTQIQSGSIPGEFQLLQNHPNPFNPETKIQFSIPVPGHIKIQIYNSLGQSIRQLVAQHYSAGQYSVKWDGKDDNGVPVSSGVYPYKLQAGDFIQVKKMSLLR